MYTAELFTDCDVQRMEDKVFCNLQCDLCSPFLFTLNKTLFFFSSLFGFERDIP